MEINKKDLIKYLESESIDDLVEFEHILSEAESTCALNFLEINNKDDSIEFNKTLEQLKDDLETVNNYFESLDDPKVIKTERAQAYDDATEDSRGADDGTYDYAGTYVISILSILIAYTEAIQWVKTKYKQ